MAKRKQAKLPELKREQPPPDFDLDTPIQPPTGVAPMGRATRQLSTIAPPPPEVVAFASTAPQAQSGGLIEAQRDGDLMRFLSRQGQAFDEVGRIIAGVPGRADMQDDAGDRPVQQYMQREQLAQQQRKTALEARLKDPSSPESRAAQDRIRKVAPGLVSEEALASVSAADAEDVLKVATDQARLKANREATTAKLQSEERQQQSDREFKQWMVGGQQQFSAQQAAIDRAFREGQGQADRDLRLRIAELERQEKNDDKSEARQEKLAERSVGGFEFDPASPPTADAAKQMSRAKIAHDNIVTSLTRMEQLFSEYGTELSENSTAGSTYASVWKDINDNVRVLSEMGVPNASDYVMLAMQVPKPVGIGATATPNSAIAAKFPELRRQMTARLMNTAKALKYTPVGGFTSEHQPTSPSAPFRPAPSPASSPSPSPGPTQRQPVAKPQATNGLPTLRQLRKQSGNPKGTFQELLKEGQSALAPGQHEGDPPVVVTKRKGKVIFE